MASHEDVRMTGDEQARRRAWFRQNFDVNIPFTRLCGMRVVRWLPDDVAMRVTFADKLSAHPGVFHGGVIATLIDTVGIASVMSGHDFDHGSRISTIGLQVNYLSVAVNEDLLGAGRCIKHGRGVHVAEVRVTGATSGKLLAVGTVSASISGERAGLLEPLPSPEELGMESLEVELEPGADAVPGPSEGNRPDSG